MRSFRKKKLKTHLFGRFGPKDRFWTIFGQKGAIFEFSVKMQKRHFFTHFFHFSIQQAHGARSLRKFPKYRNKKKSEKQIFTPKEIFQVWINLKKSRKTELFKKINGDYRGLKLFKKYKNVHYVRIT